MVRFVSDIYDSYSFDSAEDERVRHLYSLLGDWLLLADSVFPDEIFIKIKG